MLPRVLKGFAVYVDGRGYVGRAESVKLPDLSIKTDEYRASGMDAPVELDMGTDKLDCQVTFAEWDPNLIKLWGLFNANTPIVIRGALQRQGEPAVPVSIRLQGGVKQIGRDDLKQGDKASMQVTWNCNRYREEQAGDVLIDIDILNMTRIVGGVDQLAGIRAALGA